MNYNLDITEIHEKMRKMGAPESCVGSRAVNYVVAIISRSDNPEELINDYWDSRYKLKTKYKELEDREHEIELKRIKLDREKEEFEEYKREHGNKIFKLETPEARDRMRLAIYYEEAVEIDNGYQKTEYIKALGAILSGNLIDVKSKDELGTK